MYFGSIDWQFIFSDKISYCIYCQYAHFKVTGCVVPLYQVKKKR